MHGTSISRSVGRSRGCCSTDSSPFQCILYISSQIHPPLSSIRCSFTYSFVRSFVRLLTHCAKVHSGKRTKLSQRRRGEKRKGGSVRIGKEKKERDCERYWHSVARSLARCHSKESDNITYERANDGQFSIFKLLRRTCVDFVIALCHANEPTTFRRILFH